MVGHETGMTFVPSEAKLMSVRSECGDACVEVYQRAPVMRPLVLLGPTSKESEVCVCVCVCVCVVCVVKLFQLP